MVRTNTAFLSTGQDPPIYASVLTRIVCLYLVTIDARHLIQGAGAPTLVPCNSSQALCLDTRNSSVCSLRWVICVQVLQLRVRDAPGGAWRLNCLPMPSTP